MAEYPNYVAGVPDGSATGIASIGGIGVRSLGSQVNTLTTAGAVSNILDDGSGNLVVTGTVSSVATNPTPVTSPGITSGATVQNPSAFARVLYQRVVAGATGTAVLSIGSTLGATINISGTLAVAAGNDLFIQAHIPASWYVKLALTTVTYGQTTWV